MAIYPSEDGLFDCFDGEPVVCLSDRRIVARKAHVCGECRHPIVPGEKYHYRKYLFDGTWSDEKSCVCCENARCAVAEAAGDNMCIVHGELWSVAEWLVQEDVLTRVDLDGMKVA